ncbi:MAG: hypothetical protein M1837_004856 [Sclerophora amabilis]|nr:MAG: hypothetical protein M1837_004856 [Sclerophora amabilis]
MACPNCGIGLSHSYHEDAQDAQRRIAELESQVRILTGKATAAVDKLADYEDELRRLKTSQSNHPVDAATDKSLSPNEPISRSTTPTGVGNNNTRHSLLSSFLTSRKSISNLQSPSSNQSLQQSSPSATDLQAALTREQSLRQQAEGQLLQANGELEELSVQLFQQANEMVATERKARAKLEERVEVLERRDGEKRKRLERLEGAVKRIERVRGLLGAP